MCLIRHLALRLEALPRALLPLRGYNARAPRLPVIAARSIPTPQISRAYRLVHPQRVTAGSEPRSRADLLKNALHRPRPGRAAPARCARTGLRHPDPDPGAGHSRRAQGRRPAGRRADRHRQDRRLRAADAAAPDGRAVQARCTRPRRHPRADPDADPRTRGPGRGERAHLRQARAADQHGDVRRRRHAAADRPPAQGRRHPGRHARPPARPPRPAHARPEPRRDLRARRSRPHARHGLHPRHQEGAGRGAGEEAEPAVLGHLQRRDQGPGRQAAEPAGADRSGAPQLDRRGHRAEGAPGRPRAQEGPAGAPDQERRLAPGAGLHAHEAWRQPAHRLPERQRHQRDGDPRQQEPDRAHQGAGRLQERRPAGAGGDRHRRARHRHRPVAARRQLRAAQRARRLRAPHRPHRPRRRHRRGDLAGLRRRRHLPARHRAADQAQHPARSRARLRAAGRARRPSRSCSAA